MITLTRTLAREIYQVFRKGLALTNRTSPLQLIRISTGPEGLQIQSATTQFAISYDERIASPVAEIVVPLEILKFVGGKKSDPVTFVSETSGEQVARWQEGTIPRQARWPALMQDAFQPIPALPDSFVENCAELWAAMKVGATIADHSSSRYALHCLQLRGREGAVIATDGRQIFKQTGFSLGTPEDLLVLPSPLLLSTDWGTGISLQLGVTADFLVLRQERWTLHLPIVKDQHFPRVDYAIPAKMNARTILRLDPADCCFLVDSLPKMPGLQAHNQPLTVDLNGHIAIRCQDEGDRQPTDLILDHSQRTGAELQLATDRRFLLQATRLGFHDIFLTDNQSPALCEEGSRTYVWSLLGNNAIIPANDQATVIHSPCISTPSTPTSSRPEMSENAEDSKPARSIRMQIQGNRQPSSSPPVAEKVETVPQTSPTVHECWENATELKKLLRTILRTCSELTSKLQLLKRRRKRVPTSAR